MPDERPNEVDEVPEEGAAADELFVDVALRESAGGHARVHGAKLAAHRLERFAITGEAGVRGVNDALDHRVRPRIERAALIIRELGVVREPLEHGLETSRVQLLRQSFGFASHV